MRHWPDEILLPIFEYACDSSLIMDYAFANAMDNCEWVERIYANSRVQWQLISAEERMHFIQRRNHITKKAIISTCKAWRRVGSEFLFRTLFVDDPAKLRELCGVLSKGDLGRWPQRIHLTGRSRDRGRQLEYNQQHIVDIIKYCPNLEIFIVEWPMGDAFGKIADSLRTSRHLRSVHWNVPPAGLRKVTFALQILRHTLKTLSIEIEGQSTEDQLQQIKELKLDFKHLESLTLVGHSQQFIEKASDWEMPKLKSLTIDYIGGRDEMPDVNDFLSRHGSNLTYLSLAVSPALDTATILDMCPCLETFTFEGDWILHSSEDQNAHSIKLVNSPHHGIKHIGLSGLLHAFGVGVGYHKMIQKDVVRSRILQRTNDLNFAAITKHNFPNLKTVRVLSRTLLSALEENDGPGKEGYPRWQRWWQQCSGMGVRLEDCTGALLGTLPDKTLDDDDDSDGSYEYETEEEEEVSSPPPPQVQPSDGPVFQPTGARLGTNMVDELRQLLAECKAMTADRDPPLFPSQ